MRPFELHRLYLDGSLTEGELIVRLVGCGVDDETVRREVPDRRILNGYLMEKLMRSPDPEAG